MPFVTEWDFSEAEMRGSDQIRDDFVALAQQPGLPVEVEGDTASAIASSAQTLEATYEFPFLSHAPMEPLNCTIEKVGDRWYILRSGTQNQTVDPQTVADYLRCPWKMSARNCLCRRRLWPTRQLVLTCC